VHCSLWTYHGDPDDLAARYEAMVTEVPIDSMQFSACFRTPDGIVVFDTCPSKEVFDEFISSDGLRSLMARHGLDHPTSIVDHPMIAAFADGRRVDT
jgi:hypothetical protein